MLHGKTVIELQDTRTGEVTRTVDHNMVTNALNSLLNEDLHGALNRRFIGNIRTDITVPNDNSGKVQDVALGGIALFDEQLTLNANVEFERAPISYASAETYSGINNNRGTFNSSLSQPITNGYRWVYDFSPERANHTFKAVGLTSRMVGRGPYNATDVTNQTASELALQNDYNNDYNNCGYYVGTQAEAHRRQVMHGDDYFLCGKFPPYEKYKVPSSTRLNFRDTILDSTGYIMYEHETITPDVSVTNCWICSDPVTQKLYLVQNSGNSSGNATLTVTRYDPPNFSTATQFTLVVSAPIKAPHELYGFYYKGMARNGYIYLPSYDEKSMYKISVSDATDITQFSIPNGSQSRSNTSTGIGCTGNIMLCENGLWFPDGTFWDIDRKLHRQCGFGIYTPSATSVWGWFETHGYREWTTMRVYNTDFYLATKNNLAEAVTKTSSQTMRITYELTYGA